MNRRLRRVLAATAAIALFSSLLGFQHFAAAPEPHADVTSPATPFAHASWQQTLMGGKW